MKFIRCLFVLLCLVYFSGFAASQESAKPIDVGPSIEAPVALNNVMMTLTISDLHGFLDEFGAVASQVNPMMGGPVMKAMLGSKLNDPQLAAFAPGKGLSVVMLNSTNLFVVAEVEPTQVATYIQGFQTMGLVAKQQGGVLLVAKGEGQLAAAEPLALKVQADLLEVKREPSLRISARPAELIAEKEEWINTGMQQMLAQMKQTSVSNNVMDVQKILEAELQVFLSISRQVDSVELALAPIAGSIHLSKTVQPVVGSRLAAYCNAPSLEDYNPKIQAGMLPDGAIKAEFCVRNPDALVEFFNGEMTNLFKLMDLNPAYMDPWSAYMTRWMGAIGSSACESIFTDGVKPFGFSFLEDVKDEEALLVMLRSMSSDLDAMGLFKFYESMGMPMSAEFEENVRTVSGVNVHRLKMDFDLKNVPPEQAEAMEEMMGDMSFDLAVCNDVLIYTAGDEAMEKMIEQLKSGVVPDSQLAARSAFPSGGFYYADFDIGEYLGFISSFMGQVPDATASIQKICSVMEGAEPVVMTGFCNSGRLKLCSQLPADLLARFAQVGQMMAMETMQKNAAIQAEQKAQQPVGPAPDGTLNLLDGTSVQLSSFVGKKVVVLDFWASWCGPCRKGLPMVQVVADYFTGKDVVFYAVNLREDAETVKAFFVDAGLSLPVALDDGALSEAFGVMGIPHTVVIGKNGNIQSVHTGFSDDLDVQLTAEIGTALEE